MWDGIRRNLAFLYGFSRTSENPQVNTQLISSWPFSLLSLHGTSSLGLYKQQKLTGAPDARWQLQLITSHYWFIHSSLPANSSSSQFRPNLSFLSSLSKRAVSRSALKSSSGTLGYEILHELGRECDFTWVSESPLYRSRKAFIITREIRIL